MEDSWLFLDVSFLAYRNYYAMGGLSYDGKLTGVAYGILRDIVNLRQLHNTDNLAFFFDRGRSKRALHYSEYKTNRKGNEPGEEHRTGLLQQVKDLHNKYLRTIGFRNIFSQQHYEADDLIASAVIYSLGRVDCAEAIIVSSDSDLYQLLGKNVCIWNPSKKKMITEETFREEWGISPVQWVDVKAMAGCASDNIPGIPGIGERTAIKHLCGTLNPKSKAFEKIIRGTSIWENNLKLVELPFEGTKQIKLQPNEIKDAGWREVAKELGIKKLRW